MDGTAWRRVGGGPIQERRTVRSPHGKNSQNSSVFHRVEAFDAQSPCRRGNALRVPSAR